MSETCGYCLGIRLVGWSGAGPILCPSCSDGQDAFTVITQAWREQRALVVALAAELDRVKAADIEDLQRRVDRARVLLGGAFIGTTGKLREKIGMALDVLEGKR